MWTWILLGLVVLAVIVTIVALRRRAAPSARSGRPVPTRPAKRAPARPSTRPGGSAPGRGKGSSSGSRTGGASSAGTRTRTPQTGEIWWADVPYEDGPGSKIRPCLVLRGFSGGFEVLKITSQDQSHRRDHVEIPTVTWDPDATHNSYLDLSDPIRVTADLFQDRAGVLDAAVWKQVRALHAL